ncbi:MAG: hypothetical protein AAFX85_09895 [Pseudomonadota bacterium]
MRFLLTVVVNLLAYYLVTAWLVGALDALSLAWWWDIAALVPGALLVWGLFQWKAELPAGRGWGLRFGSALRIHLLPGMFGAGIALGVFVITGCLWMVVSMQAFDWEWLGRGIGRTFPVVLLAGGLASVVPIRRAGRLALYSAAPMTAWILLVARGAVAPYSGAVQ